MRERRGKIATFAVLSLCSIMCAATIKKYVKHQNFLLNATEYSRILFYNATLVHARCDSEDTWLKSNCTFHLVDFGLDERTNRTSCNVELLASYDKKVMQNDRIKLLPLGKSRTLARWVAWDLEDSNRLFKTVTLDFDGCESFESSVDSLGRYNMPQWIAREQDAGAYEVYVWESDRFSPNFAFLGLGYDFEGDFVDGPKQGLSDMRDDIHFLKMVALPPNSTMEYLLIEQHCQSMNDDEKIAVLSLFSSNGTKIPLKSYHSIYDRFQHEYLNPIYTLTNGTIGSCSKKGRRALCSHFSHAGRSPVYSSLDLENELFQIAMCDVPAGGGFLLLVVECIGPSCQHRSEELRYRVVKFDRAGEQVGQLEAQSYTCGGSSDDGGESAAVSKAQIFAKDSGGYCLTLLCGEHFVDRDKRSKGELFRFDACCFSDDDFVVPDLVGKSSTTPKLYAGAELETTV